MTMAKLEGPAAAPGPSDGTRNDDTMSSVAHFDGSFAATARPTETSPFPWYRRREYFLSGWLDIQIWKAAVRRQPPRVPWG